MQIRYLTIIVTFIATYTTGKLASDFALLIIEMAEQELSKNVSRPECVRRQIQAGANESEFIRKHNHVHLSSKPDPLTWDKDIQARLRGAYFYGYTMMNFFGGTISEIIGPRLAVTLSLSISGILSSFITFSATIHWSLIFVIRLLIGVGTGVVYPACQVMIARWAPQKEKEKFVMTTLGGNVGIFLTFLVQGIFIERTNWIYGALYTSVFSLLASLIYYIFIRDYPDLHPYIKEEELSYLREELADRWIKNKKPIPPFGKIFTNVPFWALVILQFGSCWGLALLISSQPQYMADVMGLYSDDAGMYSSFGHLMRAIMGISFSLIGEQIARRNCCSKLCQRKFYVIFSHLIPAFLLCCMAFIECSLLFAVLLPTIALGFNGSAVLTGLINTQELSPKFAGTLFGIANCIGMSSGFIIAELVGVLTRNKSEYDLIIAWKYIFVIGGFIYGLSGIIFMLIGSTDLQPFD